MDPTNIALWLILIAVIALIPCGCIMTRPRERGKSSVPAEAALSTRESPATSNNQGSKGSEYWFRLKKDSHYAEPVTAEGYSVIFGYIAVVFFLPLLLGSILGPGVTLAVWAITAVLATVALVRVSSLKTGPNSND